MTYDLVADYIGGATAFEKAGGIDPALESRILQFHRFVQARAYILASRPEQTFAQVLLDLSIFSCSSSYFVFMQKNSSY